MGLLLNRCQEYPSPVSKVIGFALLWLMLPALLALWHFPEVRGAVPAGGLLGVVVSSGLTGLLNPMGAHLVVMASFLAGLFLTTSFSFIGAHQWLRGPMGALSRLGIFERLRERYQAWREAREQERLRKRLEEIKIAGRPPVPPQTMGAKEALKKRAEQDEKEAGSEAEKSGLVVVANENPPAVQAKLGLEPRIARGVTSSRLPSPSLLRMAERGEKLDEDDLKDCARSIERKCEEFDVKGHVTQINPGPVVTTYEFKPEAGIKYSRITSLAEDLCLALKAESILMERIPGKSTVGIEVPNVRGQTIALREQIESAEFVTSSSKLTLALGKDLIGRNRVSDLAQMPHLLIAGSTGTGKSVFLNSLILSMLYKATPDELKLLLVDPKRLELGLYEEIPHLLAPVVTDPKVASNVLRNATREMERRVKILAPHGGGQIHQNNTTFAHE